MALKRSRRMQILPRIKSPSRWKGIFDMRKETIMKKAKEIEICCGVLVSVTIRSQTGVVYFYSSNKKITEMLTKSGLLGKKSANAASSINNIPSLNEITNFRQTFNDGGNEARNSTRDETNDNGKSTTFAHTNKYNNATAGYAYTNEKSKGSIKQSDYLDGSVFGDTVRAASFSTCKTPRKKKRVSKTKHVELFLSSDSDDDPTNKSNSSMSNACETIPSSLNTTTCSGSTKLGHTNLISSLVKRKKAVTITTESTSIYQVLPKEAVSSSSSSSGSSSSSSSSDSDSSSIESYKEASSSCNKTSLENDCNQTSGRTDAGTKVRQNPEVESTKKIPFKQTSKPSPDAISNNVKNSSNKCKNKNSVYRDQINEILPQSSNLTKSHNNPNQPLFHCRDFESSISFSWPPEEIEIRSNQRTNSCDDFKRCKNIQDKTAPKATQSSLRTCNQNSNYVTIQNQLEDSARSSAKRCIEKRNFKEENIGLSSTFTNNTYVSDVISVGTTTTSRSTLTTKTSLLEDKSKPNFLNAPKSAYRVCSQTPTSSSEVAKIASIKPFVTISKSQSLTNDTYTKTVAQTDSNFKKHEFIIKKDKFDDQYLNKSREPLSSLHSEQVNAEGQQAINNHTLIGFEFENKKPVLYIAENIKENANPNLYKKPKSNRSTSIFQAKQLSSQTKSSFSDSLSSNPYTLISVPNSSQKNLFKASSHIKVAQTFECEEKKLSGSSNFAFAAHNSDIESNNNLQKLKIPDSAVVQCGGNFPITYSKTNNSRYPPQTKKTHPVQNSSPKKQKSNQYAFKNSKRKRPWYSKYMKPNAYRQEPKHFYTKLKNDRDMNYKRYKTECSQMSKTHVNIQTTSMLSSPNTIMFSSPISNCNTNSLQQRCRKIFEYATCRKIDDRHVTKNIHIDALQFLQTSKLFGDFYQHISQKISCKNELIDFISRSLLQSKILVISKSKKSNRPIIIGIKKF